MSIKTILYLPIISLICVFGLCNMINVNRSVLAKDVIKSSTSNIKVSLSSNTDVTVNQGEYTNIKYSIKPQEYTTGIDEAVFLVDVSQNMKDKDNWTRGRGQFAQNVPVNINDLVNNSEKNLGIRANIKGTVIGFADDAYSLINQNLDKDMNNVQMRQSNNIDSIANNIIGTINNMSSQERNINNALEKADLLFQDSSNNTEKNQNKAIIIISSGKINNINSSTMNKIKNSGYRIIILDVSSSDDNSTDSESESNLKSVISNLSGDENYLFKEIHPSDSTSLSKDDKEKIAMNKNIYFKIIPKYTDYADSSVWRPALQSAIYGSVGNNVSDNSYKVENAKLTFDLAGNFTSGQKAIIEYNGQKEYVDIKDIGNNKIEIDISKFIKYEKDEKGFKPTIENFTVSFDVTAIGAGGTFGKDSDGKDLSNFSYKETLGNAEINRVFPLETPTIHESKLSFDIDINATPNPSKVNEDITITGNIIPNDFTINVPEKDIVLVLDVSNSMTDKIKGTGKTRLENMNDAVMKFLDIVKDTPNMKISIVAYSSDAFVNPTELNGTTSIWKKSSSVDKTILDYKCSSKTFFDVNSQIGELRNIVQTVVTNVGKIYYNDGYKYNGIDIEGGTSTGEALRQAHRILDTTEVDSKNKSIILMTDGVASYYSSNSNAKVDKNIENSFYTDINEKTLRNNKNKQKNDPPYLGGGGSISNANVVENATKYAEKIGENIEKNNENINMYTIGYGVGDNTKYIERIHKSIAKDTRNLYFRSDDEGVENAFTDIASKISTEQESNNLVIKLDLPSNIQSKDGNDIINLDGDNTIKYNGQYINNGTQIKYVAEKVPFSFIIKGSSAGTYDLFGEENDSKINFKIMGEDISIKLPKINLIIGIPDIQAELNNKGDYLNSSYKLGDEIPVTYTIKPQKFRYNGSDSDNDQTHDPTGPKDIVFVIDTSKKMQDKWSVVEQALRNKIILNHPNDRFSIITYDSEYEYKTLDDYSQLTGNMLNNGLSSYGEAIDNMFKEILNEKKNYDKDIDECNLSDALKKSCDILENGRGEKVTEKFDIGRGKAGKNIIIIGASKVNLSEIISNGELIKKIKQYNPITLDLGNIDPKERSTDTNLKQLQYSLRDKNIDFNENLEYEQRNNYYINIDYRKYNGDDPYNIFSDSNNFNKDAWIEDPVIVRIKDKLLGPIVTNSNKNKSYDFKIKLKFDLNSNFSIISGLNLLSNDSLGYTAETNDIPITYTLNSDDEYEAPEQIVTFKIKPLNSGELKFGIKNNIVYKGIGDVDLNNSIETPIINVNSINIIHGIYEGGTEINELDQYNNFCNEAVVPMAAIFDYTSSGQIRIDLNEGLIGIGKPKIYKIDNIENLTLVNTTSQFNDKKYVCNEIHDLGRYIVVYNVKLNKNSDLDEEQFTSTFTIYTISKPYKLRCIQDSSLPDLF